MPALSGDVVLDRLYRKNNPKTGGLTWGAKVNRASYALFFLLLLLTYSSISISEALPPLPSDEDTIDVSEFDHLITGFPLEGEHRVIDCESCHTGGVFEELPTLCSHCHDGNFAVGQSSSHIPTTENCDSCHTPIGFQLSAMTGMDHTSIGSLVCSACHNNVTATGKGPAHLPTKLECDNCHDTNSWAVSGFDHSTVVGQPCFECHNNTYTTGKSANHINTTNECGACHTVTVWIPVNTVDHGQVIGECISCHNNEISSGKAQSHIPTTDNCGACHSTDAWNPVTTVDHTQVEGACYDCHNHILARGKDDSHIESSNTCDSCHNVTAWIPTAQVDHSQVSGTCVSCHDGIVASGKNATHLTTSNDCAACHTTNTWTPATGVDHTQTIGSCVSCHNGEIATGQGPNHIVTSEPCDTCHTTENWLVPAFDHSTVAGQACFDCHEGTRATGKSTNHINSTNICEACHSTTVWSPVDPLVDHAQIIGTCESCHDGVIATGKGPNHIPTADPCDTCHTTTSWVVSAFDHSTTTEACIACHDGVISTGKSATHINTTDLCEACHTSTTVWTPVDVANVDHAQVVGTCVSCHDGIAASGKSTSHITSTDACDACHQPGPTPWQPVDNSAVDHNEVIGVCSSCHDNVIATGQGPGHVPTTDECDTCHTVGAWIPAVVDHTPFIDNCVSCHDGIAASGKGPTHINSTDQCHLCHQKAPQLWTPVANNAVDHGQVVGTCVSCHDGIIASGKSASHINTSDSCDACHQPGPTPWTPVANNAVDHGQVVGTCVSCHDGVIASGKSPSHINTTDLCEACHQPGPTPWTPVANADVNHNEVIGICSSCHDNVIATGQGPTHIPTTNECDTCHNVTAWTPVVAVDHSTFVDNCISCHDGITASGKTPAHINTSDQCHLCHEVAPALWTPVAPAAVNHTQVVGTCFSCHDGIVASGKGPVHITTSDNCDACHQPGPIPWAPVANADVNHSEVIGTCISCHDGIIASGKSANHISTTDACDACHGLPPQTWAPLPPSATDHAQVIGTCESCHDNVIARGKGVNHVVTVEPCDTCHTTDNWIVNFDHATVTGQACFDCHDGVVATGKNPSHITTSNLCEACHQPGPTPWAPVAPNAVDHNEVIGVCSSCHDNVIASGKGPTHVPTTDECDVCHTVGAWIPASVDHTPFIDNCISCHDGVLASGKSSIHINTTDQCHLCHEKAPALWTPVAPAAVDHSQVLGTCISCHDGTIASGKSATHINSTDACDACHQPGPTPWAPVANAAVNHAEVIGICSSCHDNVIATGKGPTHVATTEECDICHTVDTWLTATVDHGPIIDNCISCHDGVSASGKSATHINSSDQCQLCHEKAPARWTPVAPAAVDHSQVIGTCISCHEGTIASGKSATHINSSDVCEACHQPGPTPWIPVANSAVDHAQVIGVCSSCHDNVIATGKGPTHIATTEECDICHTVDSWLTATVDHAPIVDNCISCHDGVSASGKGPTHINSTDQCQLCHEKAPATWIPVANGAVDHTQVVGTCVSCHDGVIASGKGANHINSTDVCEACHGVPPQTWAPLAPSATDHAQVIGTCESCHDNVIARGKGVNHVVTIEPCDTCHTTDSWLVSFDHATVAGQPCFDCHDGVIATGKNPTHINTTDLCETCHQSGPTPWAPVIPSAVDHTQVIGVCSSCHDNVLATGKGSTHVPTTDECDTCHTVSAWIPASVDHTPFIDNCISCHDGVTASGKSATHINTTDQCHLCHETAPATWMPVAPASVDHTQVLGTCISCHDGTIASGKSATHINSSDLCDTCHLPGPTPWIPVAPSAVDHAQVTGTCVSCHDGTIASGKSATHINSTNTCDACHAPGPTPWVPVEVSAVDHGHVIGTCASCHDGTIASGKSVTHINTSDLCDACHQPGPTPWVPVVSSAVDHAQVLGTCVSCHDGTIALGRGPAHINTTDVCDACHQPGPIPWIPVANAAVDHAQVIGTCVSCHDGNIASGKSATHINTTDTCEACHGVPPQTWVPLAPSATDHAQVIGTCESCHDNVIARGKGINHVVTVEPCDTCHTTDNWLVSFDHATVAGQPCIDCHDGVIATGKNPSHIATTDLCEACHQPGPTPWAPVIPSAVDHTQVIGVCSSCHDNVIATGKGPVHVPTTDECDTCHSVTTWIPASVDHTLFVDNCVSCHDGVTASGKSATHINTTDQCHLCHEKAPATWVPVTPVAVDHTQVIGTCASCHDGTIASGKSATHITSSDLCDACHQPGPTPWVPVASSSVDHAQVQGTCASCHDGVIASGKSAAHISTTDVCEACHQPGPTPWMPVLNAAVNHDQVLGTCVSCHDGILASGKSASHIPSSDQCDSCHSVPPNTWLTVTPAAVDHTQVVGTCVSCHDGIIATGKSATHISTTNLCEACHTISPLVWIPVAPSAVDHNEVIGVCSSCHNNVVASGKTPTHIVTTQECDRCHTVNAWIPTDVDHTPFTTNCTTCHNNVIAIGKSATHINSTDRCELCHEKRPATFAPVPSSAVDHTQVIGICSSCHNGTIASGKSVNHINSSNTCDACHLPGPVPWIPVDPSAVDHSHVIGTCASCHNGTIASGKSASHITSSDLCDACHQPAPSPWIPVAGNAVDHNQVIGTCFSCHNGTVASGKSVNHINSSNTCDACHLPGPTPWIPVANSAVDHNEVIGVCSSCHDNVIAQGKGPTHIPTTLECDNCHVVTSWLTVTTPDHTGFVNNCFSCHDGTTASGKSVNHINTSNNCDTCHAVFPATWVPVASNAVDHNEVIGTCFSCHNSTVASGKSANHINSTNTCDACHLPGPTPWIPVANSAVDHGQVIGTCVSCHNGVIASGKSLNHINSTDTCDACHLPGPTPWTPVANTAVDHAHVIGTCFSCHNGTVASGKSANHINSTDVCDACHLPGPTPWLPVANSAVDHNQVIGVCSSCHDNVTAQGKGPTHIQTTLECDNCHVVTSWLTVTTPDHTGFVNNCFSCHDGTTASGKSALHINSTDTCDACHAVFPATWAPIASNAVDHTQVIGTCFSCHNGTVASGKSAGHISSTNTCDACHQPGPTPWIPVANSAVDHGNVIGTCASCHNGTIASGKSASHINSTDTCDTCHQPGPTPWAPVANSAVDHTQVIGTCVSCHNGTTASGKSPSHINSTDVCDACHQPGPTPWMPVANSAVDHNEVIGVCSSCHNNVVAQGKGPTHVQTTLECDNCHVVSSWLTVSTPDHTGFANNCFTCHDGTTASGKSATHINTTNTCDACHAVAPATWAPVASNAVDHTQVIGTCFSCHNGTVASSKSANHINSTNTCDACHQPGPTPWIPVANSAVDHGQVIGTCASCHNNVVASGKSASHINSSDVCDTCHQPGPIPWAPVANVAVDHNQVIGTCFSCHNGTTASGKSANHINTTNICDACHLPGPTPWAPVANSSVDHNEVIGVCSSCHNNVVAQGKGPTHIQTTLECDNCHNTTNWLQVTTVDHTGFVNNCFSCHNGTTASGKSASHINSTNTCDACHAVFPATWAPVAASAVDHTQVIGTCFSCHNGTTASGKPANHINSTNTCDACHQPGPTPWAPVAPSAVDHGNVIGTCASCHNNVVAGGKPANHINSTDLCDSCHQPGPTPWAPVAASAVDHNQVIGTCFSCHNGTTASGKSANHISTTNICDACHQPGPTPWAPVAASAVDHNEVIGTCSSCHNNVTAQGKPPGHIQTTLECDNCHVTTSWLQITTVDHTGFSGNCISCHNGTTASGKSASHINSTNSCDACHTVAPTPWAPVAPSAVDHTQVIGTCFSCHNGTVASGKSGNHINSTNTCDACHQPGPTPWAPVQASNVDHTQVVGTCASCHNNVIAQGKPASHPNTTDQCDACHNVPPNTWLPFISPLNHNEVIGTCFSCHNGTIAQGKPGNHPNTTNNCEACHSIPPTAWVNFITPLDHNEVIGTCVSCHNNIIAQGKPGNHPNTTDNCDACHRVPPSTWLPFITPLDHNEVIGTCVSCHNGSIAQGKPGNHPNTTDLCEACHRVPPSSWLPFITPLDHNQVIGTCVSCHDGIIAQGKPGNHPNTTNLCEACHRVPPTPWASFITPLDHNEVIGTCVSCHNNVIALGKPGNHPNTTDVCEACHMVPPSTFANLISPIDHNEVLGTCFSCHNGTIATGKSASHPSTTNVCEACHLVPPTNWINFITPLDHNEVIGSCVSCHNGTIAQGKPGNHPNTTDNCDACHRVPPSSWLPFITPLDHNEVLGVCVSCHDGGVASGKPGNHPPTSDVCEACHMVPPATWTNLIIPLDHSQVLGSCVSCHDGGIATGKSASHPNTTDFCENCHSVPPTPWTDVTGTFSHADAFDLCTFCHDGGIATGKPSGHCEPAGECSDCHTTSNWTAFADCPTVTPPPPPVVPPPPGIPPPPPPPPIPPPAPPPPPPLPPPMGMGGAMGGGGAGGGGAGGGGAMGGM